MIQFPCLFINFYPTLRWIVRCNLKILLLNWFNNKNRFQLSFQNFTLIFTSRSWCDNREISSHWFISDWEKTMFSMVIGIRVYLTKIKQFQRRWYLYWKTFSLRYKTSFFWELIIFLIFKSVMEFYFSFFMNRRITFFYFRT